MAALLLAAGLAAGGAAAAQALPPDGPGPETPGTSSRVWPSEVKVGDLLYFEVSGYPPNETVYIKIDDGLMCSDTSHGACVYATQRLDGNGYATGSIVVPPLPEGAHWLRMLATGDMFDSQTGQKIGYQGYTRRGGNDFVVVAGGSAAAPVPGGGAVNADGSIVGGTVAIDAGEATPAPTATPGAPGSMDAITTKVVDDPSEGIGESGQQAQGPAAGEPVPLLGIAVLGGAVVLGGGALAWALVRRRRLGADGG